MSDTIVLITGATDGLGKRVARDFADRGAEVLLHGRNPEKGEAVLEELRKATANDKLTYYNADFASLDDVREMADRIARDRDRLDILVNNAGLGFGVPGSGRLESRDGYELRFQVNYLAGFLLTIRLLPLLKRSPSARIINVASGAQRPIDFDEVMLEHGYSGKRAYSQSKLAQIMFTVELAKRFGSSGPAAYALHPATYMDTNMVREAAITPTSTVQQGADAVEYVATSPDVEAMTGTYFNEKRPSRAAEQAYDARARRQLWALSERLTGLTADV